MRKTIIIYGCALAALIFAMKFIEYRFLVRDLSLEFYLGVVAVFFTAIGIWAGAKVAGKKNGVVHPVAEPFVVDDTALNSLGISKREYEVLDLMAAGFSNQEIADKLFVSLNTIKTHTSNLFVKLDVKRRTQAVQRAKALGLLRP